MHKESTIIIVASGHSVKAQGVAVESLQLYGRVVAVNEAAMNAPCDVIVSMDRLWMECRYKNLFEMKKETWLRQAAHRKNLKTEQAWHNLNLFACDNETDEFSQETYTLNGFNSGYCALNYAYKKALSCFAPRRVFLFGFDHKSGPAGEPYWHAAPPYQNADKRAQGMGKYVSWAKRYDRARELMIEADIEVYNVSPESAIESFRKLDYEGFRKCAI